jgi:hypothetical protein
MAEPDTEPVAAESSEPARGGFFHRIGASFKRIKPGEWVLIGIGVVGIIVYVMWYRNQQANSSSSGNALVPGGGTSNPNWGTADATPGGTFDSEIAALLAQIASGASTTPDTSTTSALGGSSATSASVGGGSLGSAAGQGLAAVGVGAMPLVLAPASSGSGLSQQANNQAPVVNQTALTVGTGPAPAPAFVPAPAAPAINSAGLAANTGTVGVPIVNSVGQVVRVPANVAPSGGNATQTVAARAQAAPAPVLVTHAVAPAPAPAPVSKPALPTNIPHTKI